jgi:hypothetical protein
MKHLLHLDPGVIQYICMVMYFPHLVDFNNSSPLPHQAEYGMFFPRPYSIPSPQRIYFKLVT